MVEVGTLIKQPIHLEPAHPDQAVPKIEASLLEEEGLEAMVELVVLTALHLPGQLEDQPSPRKVIASSPVTEVSEAGVKAAITNAYRQGTKAPGFQQGRFEYQVVFQRGEN